MEPWRGEQFNRMMAGFRQHRESFVEVFPFEDRASLMPANPGDVSLIDVARP